MLCGLESMQVFMGGLVSRGGHNPDFHVAFDFLVQVNLDRVQAKFLEWTLQAHLIVSDCDIDGLERSYNLRRTDTTVQVAFVVGVGFDSDRLLSDFVGESLQAAQALLFDLFQLGLMLVDHAFVVIIGDDRKALGEQVVVRKPRLDFDHVALATEMVYVLNEEQFNAAIRAFGQSLERLNLSNHHQLTSSLIRLEFTEPTIESSALA